jgi:hypothetical protein
VNPTYIRVALYVLSGMAAAAGFGTFDAEAGTLTLNLNEMALALAASSVVSGVIFGIWGKK